MIEEYIEYVQSQLELYKNYTDLIRNRDEIDPVALNGALAEFSNISGSISGEVRRRSMELEKARLEFEVWFDEKFCEIRRLHNDRSLSSTKWLSKQELESETRVQWKQEYLERKQKILVLTESYEFVRKLKSDWEFHGQILITLSHNSRQEMRSLAVERKANKTFTTRTDFTKNQDTPKTDTNITTGTVYPKRELRKRVDTGQN